MIMKISTASRALNHDQDETGVGSEQEITF